MSAFSRKMCLIEGAALAWLLAGAAIAAPAQEGPERNYIARAQAACEVIDYTCPPGAKSFQDDTGCGCERPRPPSEGHGSSGLSQTLGPGR